MHPNTEIYPIDVIYQIQVEMAFFSWETEFSHFSEISHVPAQVEWERVNK